MAAVPEMTTRCPLVYCGDHTRGLLCSEQYKLQVPHTVHHICEVGIKFISSMGRLVMFELNFATKNIFTCELL